jgi:hypothetical protein
VQVNKRPRWRFLLISAPLTFCQIVNHTSCEAGLNAVVSSGVRRPSKGRRTKAMCWPLPSLAGPDAGGLDTTAAELPALRNRAELLFPSIHARRHSRAPFLLSLRLDGVEEILGGRLQLLEGGFARECRDKFVERSENGPVQ